MASKSDLERLEKDMSDIKERVSKCESDIQALKEILSNGGGTGGK